MVYWCGEHAFAYPPPLHPTEAVDQHHIMDASITHAVNVDDTAAKQIGDLIRRVDETSYRCAKIERTGESRCVFSSVSIFLLFVTVSVSILTISIILSDDTHQVTHNHHHIRDLSHAMDRMDSAILDMQNVMKAACMDRYGSIYWNIIKTHTPWDNISDDDDVVPSNVLMQDNLVSHNVSAACVHVLTSYIDLP